MYWEVFVLFSYLFVCNTLAKPIYETVEDDISAVGSSIREVRATAPLTIATEVEDLMSVGNAPKSGDTKKRIKNVSDVLLSLTRADNNAVLGKSDEGGYYRTYGSDAEGEKGYLKETYGKGDQGYKTLDTFHKQDGDKYEFETQTIYGKSLADDKDQKHHNEKKNKDHEGAGTRVDYVGGERDHEEDGEYSHYIGSDDDDHNDGAYSGYYTTKVPESTSYSENYSSGDGDQGSYETHSSYNSDDDGEENEEEDYY